MPTYPLGSADLTANYNVNDSLLNTGTSPLTPSYNVSGKTENLNITNSDPVTQKNIASSKDVNSGTKKELTEAEYKKDYIREAQKIALYRDPPAWTYSSSYYKNSASWNISCSGTCKKVIWLTVFGTFL